MATKLWTQKINKYTNWAGDESTNGLPVSGEQVQKFIQDSLNNKFGKLYFDKDPISGFEDKTGTNKYLIFADETDYELWASNPADYANLVLGSFDAPAPATIEISDKGEQTKTILESDKDSAIIGFKYRVKKSDGSFAKSPMSYTISINNNISGVTNLPSRNLDMGTGNDDDFVDFKYEDIGQYLKSGVNTITITLTATLFNVSTTIIYQYNILNLNLTTSFNYANGVSLDTNDSLNIDIIAEGMGAKQLNVYIDGVLQTDLTDLTHNTPTQTDVFIGNANVAQYELIIPFKNASGEYKSWATAGLHNIQMFFFITEGQRQINSKTVYYDFVLTQRGMRNESYILFDREFSEGTIIENNETLSLEVEQYSPITVKYAVFNSIGSSNSLIDIKLKNKETNEVTFSTQAEIASGEISVFEYTTQTAGDSLLTINNTNNDNADSVKNINVNIIPSDIEITKPSNLMLELSALNRSNSEPEAERAIWKYEYTNAAQTRVYQAEFNNVLWNLQNGWQNNCLVLNNGATVTIPFNFFALQNQDGNGCGNGITFEIDFETENVQDDNAIIMTYGNYDEVKDNNGNVIDRQLIGEGIQIKACSAELQSNTGTNIHTNYKDGSRQKIQFIFGYNRPIENDDYTAAQTYEMPYLMYIVVNGILDRVAQFSSNDHIGVNTNGYESFVIGNTNNKVTTKIHSISIYRKALTLDECVDRVIADSDNIRKKYLKNDIYNEDGKTINVNRLLSSDISIPVMTIYGDVMTSIVQVFNKKSNVPVDILYQDPNYPEFNYFAHDAWMSNQGTSSMNYPRRNFRLYFNKKSDDKTLYGFASKDRYDYATRVWYGLTDSQIIKDIQTGAIDLDAPIESNGKTYIPLYNSKAKKTKGKSQEISKGIATMFVHSGIKIYSDPECTNQIGKKGKNPLNKYLKDNPNGKIYVKGAYARYKSKDLFTDRWTIKCDYAESSMTHNAGVARLWGDVMKNVEVGSVGFRYDTEGTKIADNTPGITNAQAAAKAYDEAHKGQQIKVTGEQPQDLVFGDIRTSCDGYPIVIVNRPRIKEGNNYTEDFGDPIFLGLYNIMTDKGSTPLFGFEDLYDEDGNRIYIASNAECWECLQNGSNLAQMNDMVTDDTDGSTVKYTTQLDADRKLVDGTGSDNEDRPIFKTYEARWPDNDDLNDTCTNNLETVIRFVNFCKDAVNVTVDGRDGYALSDFTHISEDQAAALAALTDKSQASTVEGLENLTNWDGILYLGVPATSYKDKTSGFYKKNDKDEVIYDSVTQKPIILDPTNEEEMATMVKLVNKGIYYFQDYAAQNVTGSSFSPLYEAGDQPADKVAAVIRQLESNRPYVFTESVDESSIDYVGQAYYDGAGDNWYIFDSTYDRSNVKKTINQETIKDDIFVGRVLTYDGKRWKNREEGELLHPEAWVQVYLTKKGGSGYTYVNEMGATVNYSSGEEYTQEVGTNTWQGSFKGATKLDYFKDKKYEHFDVWKLACYYVYIMRFAAVDQVIKNTMMTTEDGKHWYFINYDNDTVLGVRNDGYLAYDWKIDRESYDNSIGSFCYAGFGSVLWNTLEQDDDFMDKVQKVATSMVTSNVLTYDIALDMFNNKQAATWNERLYNNSELYKYIGIYNDIDNLGTSDYNPYKNIKYLPFLQGSRTSHREWWLRHRFDLYDSKWSAGEYANNGMILYMSASASPKQPVEMYRIVSGSKFYYTVQTNGRTLGNNFVELEAGEEWYPVTTSPLAIGDPMTILGGYNIEILDLSSNRQFLGSSISFDWNAKKFTSRMKEFIIGGSKKTNEQPASTLGNINYLEKLTALEVLDIRTCNQLKSDPNISTLGALRKFLASDSNITTFLPAKGLILEEVSLPQSITNIKLDTLTVNSFDYTPNWLLKKIEINKVNGEAFEGNKLFEFILNWYLTLKEKGAQISEYKCKIGFTEIVMEKTYTIEQYPKLAAILPEGTTSIDCIDLLNKIKDDFGVSMNNGVASENFEISEGILKIWGNADNDGLTEEDYNKLKDSIYTTKNDNKIKLWNALAFTSTAKFHFDAEESVFIAVTDPDGYDAKYIKKNDSNKWNIVSGQTSLITVTMFPADTTRQLTFTPYYWNNNTNKWTNWIYNQNSKEYSTGSGGTVLINNNNDSATLTIEELENNQRYAIDIKDNKNSPTRSIEITADKIVKPYDSEIYCSRLENGIIKNVYSNTVDNITSIITYEYTVQFKLDSVDGSVTYDSYDDKYNIDILKVEPSFSKTGSTPDQNGDLGTLESFIVTDTENPDIKEFKFYYTPKIVKDSFENNATEKRFSIYLWTTFNDARKSVTKNPYISVCIKKQDISNINLTFEDEDKHYISEDNNEVFNLEHYVKQYKSQLVYNYNIDINPSDFNIPIKSMTVVNSTDGRSQFIVQEGTKINNCIKDFNIIYNVNGKSTFHETGEITITIETDFGTIIRKANLTIGMYLPDEIKLLRKDHNTNDPYDVNNTNNLTILANVEPTYDYVLHIYSYINDELYVWGNNIDEAVTEGHFLSSNKTPSFNQQLTLTYSEDAVYGNILENGQILFNNIVSTSVNDKNEFSVTINDLSMFTYGAKLTYKVDIFDKSFIYQKDFVINRIAALATDFNYYNLTPYNGTTTNPLDEGSGIYFFDKNLNIYDYTGVGQQRTQMNGLSLDSYFIGMLFIYKDDENLIHYIPLDIWKLDKEVHWWDTNSTWFNTNNLKNFLLQDVDCLRVVSGNNDVSGFISNVENNINEPTTLSNYKFKLPYIFSKCYEYYKYGTYRYRIINNTSQQPHINDGIDGLFSLDVNISKASQNYEIPVETSQVEIDLHNELLSITPEISDTTNNNEYAKKMIFYYINSFKDNQINNVINMPLSSNDVIYIFNNYTLFKNALDRFYNSYIINNTALHTKYPTSFGELLCNIVSDPYPVDFDENIDLLDELQNDTTNNENVSYGNDPYNRLTKSKIFWVFDLDDLLRSATTQANYINNSFVQIWKKEGDNLIIRKNIGKGTNGNMYTDQSYLNSTSINSCLFGVYPLFA